MKRFDTSTLAMVVFGLVLISNPARGNQLLNGSFETNSAGVTQFNLSNASFNALVANSTAFGTAEEIDLVTSTDFGIAPQNGNWKLGLHTQVTGLFDQFSSTLSSPVVAGVTYDLRFYAAQLAGSGVGQVQLGLSSSPSTFGTSLYSGTPTSDSAWTQFDYQFTAAAAASYLTVRTNSLNGEMYAFIDNISLNAVPEPSTAMLLIVGLALLPRRTAAR